MSDRTPAVSDRPTFAVVIPTYNRATRLRNTLETVFRQEEPPKEIIVVDDCSTDETAEIMAELLETHTNLRYFRHEENLERSASRNTGMTNATADYVTFLDSDDLMYPRNLREAGDFVLETGALFFHNLYEMVDETGRHLRSGPAPRLSSQLRAFALGNFLACIGTFIHRDIYTEYRFDATLSASEDWDFWLRVAADHPIDRIPTTNSAIVQHEGRTMLNQDVAVATRRIHYILDKIDLDPHLSSVYGPYRSLMRASRMVFLAGFANDNRDSKAALRLLRRALVERPTMFLSPRFVRCLQIATLNWFRGP
jgi:glycosyltransferase involved in cell wall biosynthesis